MEVQVLSRALFIMNKPIKISASILCADFTRLGEEIKKCESAGVDEIHVDVMDGHFVPNLTIGPVIVQAIRPHTKLPIEAHLMTENPWFLIDSFIEAGADIISIHAECYGPLKKAVKGAQALTREVRSVNLAKIKTDIVRIKKRGKKVFLVLNPGTPLCITSLLKDIDGVLVMSVNPGYAKQKFMPVTIPKIRQLRKMYSGDIAVDGGINAQSAADVIKAGANILATASYFFTAPDPGAVVRYLKGLAR